MGSDLRGWVSDKLISILGYSHPTLVQYVISLSKRAFSAMEIVNALVEEGFMLNGETLAFAQEVFDRVEHKASDTNFYEQEERDAIILARKQKNYALLGIDEDHNQVDGGIGVVNTIPVDVELKKENTSRYRFRKRTEIQEDDDSDDEVVNYWKDERAVLRSWISEMSEEEERIRDQKDREELEKHLKERDAAGTRKLFELEKLTEKEGDGAVQKSNDFGKDDILMLRNVSRQEYLKKREQKKLKELGDDIEDEQFLFEGVKLTGAEDRDFRHKKEIYELVKKKSEVIHITKEYKMPESYDEEGKVNQEKRYDAALKHCRDANDENKVKSFAEQESWEENQIGKAIVKFGSRDRKTDR